MLEWSQEQQTFHTRQHVCTHILTICVRHHDSLLLCPVGVISFHAGKLLSLAGSVKRRNRKKKERVRSVTGLLIILTKGREEKLQFPKLTVITDSSYTKTMHGLF